MRILLDHLYQDPVGPLVQDLCIRVLWTACVRILYDHLCKISVSGSFWTTVSGSCWTTVSGSCWTTCARSVFQDLCVRILWTTCIRILQEHLYKISASGSFWLLVSLCSRFLVDHLYHPWGALAQDLYFDHFYEDPVRPLVQDLSMRILYGHLCKISVSGSLSFWTTCIRIL